MATTDRKRKWDEAGEADGRSPPPAPAPGGAGKTDAMDAAARIAAQIAAQYGGGPPAGKGQDQRELNDPDFVKDIEINDLRNRYLLTKGTTQQQIFQDTGATVTTKGVWYPDKSLFSAGKEPPLYLHITANAQDVLDKGVNEVQKLINQDLGPLTERPGFREREPRERRKWPEEKLPINLETQRNFNVRAKVVGPGGLFVKYIQQETQTRVQIKGIGSGFVETETGREAEEPMHIAITGPDQLMVDRAKELAEDLLKVVHEEFGKAKTLTEQWQQQQMWGGYGGYQQPYAQYGGQQPPPPPSEPGAAPPPPANGATMPPGSAPQMGSDQYAAWWQQIQSNPEYAAYYQQMMSYYQQQGQQMHAGGQAGPPAMAPPPPPPGAAPAPPPGDQGQRREGSGQFGGVPPPPGL